MKFLSVCSGIESASVAFEPLGWECVGVSEIGKAQAKILEYHYPQITNYGDLKGWPGWSIPDDIDLIIGGTPCQSFSIAGNEGGLDDERGKLTLKFIDMVGVIRPRWFIWENVPRILSLEKGRVFARILQEFSKWGYGLSWRVLNAKNFGVPQSRRRVFLVGNITGDPRCSAQVLFEPESLRRDSKETRTKGQEYTGALTAGIAKNSGRDLICQGVLIPVRVSNFGLLVFDKIFGTILEREHKNVSNLVYSKGMGVRKLTPLECERLQGFPDNYTQVPGVSQTERYSSLGNSKAVPVVNWVGRGIEFVDSLR
jgi:DNA (cytosine-5)-methyltransferase 1